MDPVLTYDQLLRYLEMEDREAQEVLFTEARKIREHSSGNKVYLRALVELSNICRKNCLYCGIRCANKKAERFSLDDDMVVNAAKIAHEMGFGSLVIQSGEVRGKAFTGRIGRLLRKIHQATGTQLGITLSLGEQRFETYKTWRESGAHRYLLRIETSSEDLYKKLHPDDGAHDFRNRLDALEDLKRAGYQTGSGVMIGLPYQTTHHLAKDLLFMKEMDLDMIGMGPYIPHPDTPLGQARVTIPTAGQRVGLSLRMIALLRILMKDVNIASTTALETLDKKGRLKGLLAGGNVFMPNLTPAAFARKYALYKDKPVKDDYVEGIRQFERELNREGMAIGYFEQGNPKHYQERMKNNLRD